LYKKGIKRDPGRDGIRLILDVEEKKEALMYTLIRDLGLRKALLAEAPSLFLSMVIAEIFYKFHSFTLECGAFLVTWFVVSYVSSVLRGLWSTRQHVEG